MSNRWSWLIAIWTSVVLAAATVLLCAYPDADQAPEANAPLSHVAGALTIPITLTGPSDLRRYAVAVGVAVILLLIAVRFTPRPTPSQDDRTDPSPNHTPPSQRRLIYCAAIVLGAAMASAIWNGAWEISRGWIFQCGVGLLWAMLLARLVDHRTVDRILIGGLLVAVLATAVSMWHRHQLEIRDVRWPIGPITICAALGAVWCAAVAGYVAATITASLRPTSTIRRALDRRLILPAIILFAGGSAGLMLLSVSGRRAGWLGLAAALVFITALCIVAATRKRGVRVLVCVGIVAGVATAAVWGARQAASSLPEVGGSVALRLIRWGETAELLVRRPLLGYGPDTYVCELTTALARQRAEMPHLLHGDIALAAHNEWLQAAFELGVPAALAYLLIPILAIIQAARAFLRDDDARRRARLAATAAGLVSIVVLEAVSINLRNPILPAWYWTLVGLCIASARTGSAGARAVPHWYPRASLLRIGVGAAAVAVILVVVTDIRCGRARVAAGRAMDVDDRRAAELLRWSADGFGARNWLATQFKLGLVESAVARRERDSESTQRAVATWETLVHRCPGYPEAGGRLAEALMNAGRLADARATLAAYLDQVNPYDPAANLLASGLIEQQPPGQLECARRALRGGVLTSRIERLLVACLSSPEVASAWMEDVAASERDVAERPESEWGDPLAPETLRLEASRLMRAGDIAEAARIQALAAETYGRLYEAGAPHRRPAEAEWDAWFRAADYTFRADPGAFAEAHRMVCEAERFAVLGLDHEYLGDPDPDGEFVFGQVRPMSWPDRLRPLWRLSAKLHIAAGAEQDLNLRVLGSLPAGARTPDGLRTRYGEIITELQAALASLPPDRRPNNYDRIHEIARQYADGTRP